MNFENSMTIFFLFCPKKWQNIWIYFLVKSFKINFSSFLSRMKFCLYISSLNYFIQNIIVIIRISNLKMFFFLRMLIWNVHVECLLIILLFYRSFNHSLKHCSELLVLILRTRLFVTSPLKILHWIERLLYLYILKDPHKYIWQIFSS